MGDGLRARRKDASAGKPEKIVETDAARAEELPAEELDPLAFPEIVGAEPPQLAPRQGIFSPLSDLSGLIFYV